HPPCQSFRLELERSEMVAALGLPALPDELSVPSDALSGFWSLPIEYQQFLNTKATPHKSTESLLKLASRFTHSMVGDPYKVDPMPLSIRGVGVAQNNEHSKSAGYVVRAR